MKKIIIANLKMNPATLGEAEKLLKEIKRGRTSRGMEVVFCPPFVYLGALYKKVGMGVKLGAQDAFWKEFGAFTGEISPLMLKKMGVSYVILGHSERREHLGETDQMINHKVKAALKVGLKVVLCVGERERVPDELPPLVRQELVAGLAGISKRLARNIIVAYEPLWAIGTGHPDSPENLFEMSIYIRRIILDIFGKPAAHNMPVLYGGSVDDKNARAFLEADGVNGLLVGGASLDAKKFKKILEAAR
ncbi:MAG: triose-phosphate isomerase [Patescibacteria group bacterium]